MTLSRREKDEIHRRYSTLSWFSLRDRKVNVRKISIIREWKFSETRMEGTVPFEKFTEFDFESPVCSRPGYFWPESSSLTQPRFFWSATGVKSCETALAKWRISLPWVFRVTRIPLLTRMPALGNFPSSWFTCKLSQPFNYFSVSSHRDKLPRERSYRFPFFANPRFFARPYSRMRLKRERK